MLPPSNESEQQPRKHKHKHKSKKKNKNKPVSEEVMEAESGSATPPASPVKRASPDVDAGAPIAADRPSKKLRQSTADFGEEDIQLPLQLHHLETDGVTDFIRVMYGFGKEAMKTRSRMTDPGERPPKKGPSGYPWVAFEQPDSGKTPKAKFLSPPIVILGTDGSCGPGHDFSGSYASSKHKLEFIPDEHAFSLYVKASFPNLKGDRFDAKVKSLCDDAAQFAARIRSVRCHVADELWRYGVDSDGVRRSELGAISTELDDATGDEPTTMSKEQKEVRCYKRYMTNAVMHGVWDRDTSEMGERKVTAIDDQQQFDERQIKTRRGVWSKMAYAKKGTNIVKSTTEAMEQERLLLSEPEFAGFTRKTLDVQVKMFQGDPKTDCYFDPVTVIFPGLSPEAKRGNPILSRCLHAMPFDEFPLKDGDVVQVELSIKITNPKNENGARVYVIQETIFLVHKQKDSDRDALLAVYEQRFEKKTTDVYHVMPVDKDEEDNDDSGSHAYTLPAGIVLAPVTVMEKGSATSASQRVIVEKDYGANE